MKLKKAALKAVGKIVNKVTSSTVQGYFRGRKERLYRRLGAYRALPQDRRRKRCDA